MVEWLPVERIPSPLQRLVGHLQPLHRNPSDARNATHVFRAGIGIVLHIEIWSEGNDDVRGPAKHPFVVAVHGTWIVTLFERLGPQRNAMTNGLAASDGVDTFGHTCDQDHLGMTETVGVECIVDRNRVVFCV